LTLGTVEGSSFVLQSIGYRGSNENVKGTCPGRALRKAVEFQYAFIIAAIRFFVLNLLEKETDPTLLKRSILTPVAERLRFPYLWVKRFVNLRQKCQHACEKIETS
jgi:hypothetical protein